MKHGLDTLQASINVHVLLKSLRHYNASPTHIYIIVAIRLAHRSSFDRADRRAYHIRSRLVLVACPADSQGGLHEHLRG